MPRIKAATVAEHREVQRDALLTAAATLITDGSPFTVAEVAKHVGMSRSAVYQYYSSSADLIADVLVDELAKWADEIDLATDGISDPSQRIRVWITAVIEYVRDGRHALVKSAGTIELPVTRRAQVGQLHRELIEPLHRSLGESGIEDAGRQARYVWGVVDAAISRIETEQSDADSELQALLTFVDRALSL